MLVETGRVTVGGAPAAKAGRLVGPDEAVVVLGPAARYVGRGGEKLEGALRGAGLDPTGWRVLDAGSSTGGFTDCLLQHGAAQVVAVDVGRGQLHARLRADPRVAVHERTHLRDLTVDGIGGPVDAAVADVSFISLRQVLDPILRVVVPGAPLVLLVKPQFEAGRAEVDRGHGVIRDPAVWRRVLGEVNDALAERGATIMEAMVSPLRGTDGNVEFFLVARAPADGPGRPLSGEALDAAVRAATGED